MGGCESGTDVGVTTEDCESGTDVGVTVGYCESETEVVGVDADVVPVGFKPRSGRLAVGKDGDGGDTTGGKIPLELEVGDVVGLLLGVEGSGYGTPPVEPGGDETGLSGGVDVELEVRVGWSGGSELGGETAGSELEGSTVGSELEGGTVGSNVG